MVQTTKRVPRVSRPAIGLITVFLLSLLLPQLSNAELISAQEAGLVCRNFLVEQVRIEGPWASSQEPTISRIEAVVTDADTLAWCFHIQPGGFVIVPSLRDLPPIKAFAQRGTPRFDEREGLGAVVRDALAGRLRLFREAYGHEAAVPDPVGPQLFDRCNRLAWDYLLQEPERFDAALRQGGAPGSRDQVGPLLSTAWHQTYPYNIYCPYGDGDRTVVWCVATALAQIIWYHQWPPAGFGHTSYQWDGDQSCEGDSPGLLLEANFSDRYEYNGTTEEIAELCSEVGRAYHVDYGVCYSIGYAEPVLSLLADWYGYVDSVEEEHRSDYTPEDWFAIVQREIDADRPIQYLIYNHMIVADGWRTLDHMMYYHINFGWGGAYNAWYALDNIYCGWPGCDPMVERMYTRIEPDRSLMFYADTILGTAPLTVQFTGMSDSTVDTWSWSFGDSEASDEQSPTHTYDAPGLYDVSLLIELISGDSLSGTRHEYMCVLGDSVWLTAGSVVAGQPLEVIVNADNVLPLSDIKLPIQYAGDCELALDSFSVIGCRTESCQDVSLNFFDPGNGRLNFHIQPWVSGYSSYPYVAPGSGPLLKLYFSVDQDAVYPEQATIEVSAFPGYVHEFVASFHGQAHDYEPAATGLTLEVPFLCGDVNADGIGPNIVDLTYLVEHLFGSGDPPPIPEAADMDGPPHDGQVNIVDLTYLVQYLFGGGTAPDCG